MKDSSSKYLSYEGSISKTTNLTKSVSRQTADDLLAVDQLTRDQLLTTDQLSGNEVTENNPSQEQETISSTFCQDNLAKIEASIFNYHNKISREVMSLIDIGNFGQNSKLLRDARLFDVGEEEANLLAYCYKQMPSSLQEIADISSIRAALKIALLYGGQKVYFSSNSDLLESLPLEEEERLRLSDFLNGLQLDIPLATNSLVVYLSRLGLSCRHISKLLRVCQATVKRYTSNQKLLI